MRSLGQVPNMDRPVTVQLHVHKERGMVCLRPVKAGAHILADVHIAYATDAFESLHVHCRNNQEVRTHQRIKKANTVRGARSRQRNPGRNGYLVHRGRGGQPHVIARVRLIRQDRREVRPCSHVSEHRRTSRRSCWTRHTRAITCG